MKNGVVSNNMYVLNLIRRICPGRVLAEFYCSAVRFASNVFYSVVFLKYLVGAIEAHESFLKVAAFLTAASVAYGILEFFVKWHENRYRPKTDAVIYGEIGTMLFEKAAGVELACYENPEFYNAYTLAMKEADARIFSVLRNIPAVVFAVLAGAGVLVNMFMIDRYVVLFVVSPLVGNFLFGRRLKKILFERDRESVPHRRKTEYVNRVAYLGEYAKEIRTSGIFNVLKVVFERGYDDIVAIVKKIAPAACTANFWQNLFTFLVIFQGVLLYSLYGALVTRTIALNEFAVLTGAMVAASWILIGLAGDIMTSLENSLYIENLRTFLEYESRMDENREGPLPGRTVESIEFRDVCFSYEGSKEPVLKNVSLKFGGEEKIALVGHNGAGKTTLVKLLMRLYDPVSGAILLNGRDIREYNLAEYRRLFGAAFQDFRVFSMTVAENVLMRTPENDDDYSLVRRALERGGVLEKIMSLNRGMDTVLTREFDGEGAVLSGGELQKIAIARVYAGDPPVAVFDEPSSALDPISEYNLFESMKDACRDRTVVFISHRLSSAAVADRIYLLENGEVVEEGTHGELMKRGGGYADMFGKQAEKYLREVDVE